MADALLTFLGYVKTRAARMAVYYQFFNTAMLLYLIGWQWWLLLAIPAVIIAYMFESRHGITAEMDVVWRASTEWQEYKERFERLERAVDRIAKT